MEALAGRVALVTGAADGIGLGIARRFAAEGAHVVLADINGPLAAERAGELSVRGLSAEGLDLDVRDEQAVSAALDSLARTHNGLDIAVANAGILRLAPVTQLSVADFRATLEVNLTGAFITVRAAAEVMLSRGTAGRIIVTSSLMGLRGAPTNAAYAASKFGVIGLVESAAADLAGSGILVNAVCPGQIESQMLSDTFTQRAAARGVSSEQVAGELKARIPTGRLGTAEEVADVFVYLAGDGSRYMTGQHLVVDGGWMVA